jgi:hypothetical protein
MKRQQLALLVLVGVLAFPEYASANVGTTLLWSRELHLLFGNALIGFAEGMLLAWLFSAPKMRSVLTMILANYLSAWAGRIFTIYAVHIAWPPDLNNAWKFLWIMVGLTYGMTLVLEWPFVAWCVRGAHGWFRRSLRASLVVQSASYAVLFGWYGMVSDYTRTPVVAPSVLSLPDGVTVYYIGDADGDVYRRSLTAREAQRICELQSRRANDRLLLRPSEVNTNHWDLVARLETEEFRNPRFVIVQTNLHAVAAPDLEPHLADPLYQGTWDNYGKVPDLGSATNGDWKFSTGFWPGVGLQASNKATRAQVRFAFETFFVDWAVRNAVHLPTDKVFFQLGHYQLCAFDPSTLQVALLWRGRGPVAVIEEPCEQDESPSNTNQPAHNGLSAISSGASLRE